VAIVTPAPGRRYVPPPLGAFSLSSLEVVEARLNSKLASLQVDAEAREKRLNVRLDSLAAGWETAVARLSEKLATNREGMETAENRAQERARVAEEQLDEMKKRITARNDWEEQQWGELGTQLQWEEKEMREIKQGVDSLVRENRKERKRKEEEEAERERVIMEAGLAQMRAAPQAPPPSQAAPALTAPRPPRSTAVAPAVPPAPSQPRHRTGAPTPEVHMVDVDEIEEYLDMEGVQPEELYDSQHTPPPGELDYMASQEGDKRR
jgi:hypothetical protein